uniref:Dual specificity protein phosphatase n=1 Tax=Geotrypetes seraphini TaxID=260995 RepID=A0A6P8QRU3_GEOSA|nr:dual specificity protein phosphatase 5 [Geotrypetes seraphini]
MKVRSVDCRLLRKTLRKEPARCLILDCRPYLAFCASGVKGSLNVTLNSVVVRRARGGPVPVHFVVPDEAARARLREGGVSAVIVLDEGTAHWRKLRKGSTAQIVLDTLVALQAAPQVCFLKGGYATFCSQYPECCIEQKSFSLEGSELDRNLNHCEKQSIKPPYDQGNPVEILPFLYLGSAYHASRCEFLANFHITALLNVSRKSSDAFKEQYLYKWIPVEDNHMADISSHFQEAIDFIDTVRRAGGRVLVHCEAGISRSPTICMAYLMKTKKFRLEEAFDYIKQRRSVISPNFGFMGQLLHYESECLSSAGSAHTTSCKREAVSFLTEELTLRKSFDASCYAFPTSVLASVPIRSPVHQLKLSPITASSSC